MKANTQYINLKKKLTIVIPTYNEEKYIERTLMSIVQQNNVKGLRVIVSDAYSTDKTRDIVLNLKSVLSDVISIELINGGPVAVGRNNGAQLVKTKYVLFLDGDSPLLDRNNLSHNVYLMNHKRLHLLTCKLKSVGSDIRTSAIFSLFNLLNLIISSKTPFAVGGYFMTRLDKFIEYGMFDESLNNSEDYQLSRKYSPNKFLISKMKYGQDNRRFKKMGYFGMIKLMALNYLNKNNLEWFKTDVGYWK
jgi:glycosyltransferase involved in cell wall biosynthesis